MPLQSVPLQSVPAIFDRALLRHRIARANQRGFADFLLARIADDMDDRLRAVSRVFPLAADIGTPTPLVARRIAQRAGAEATIRLAPAPDMGASLPTVVANDEMLPLARESIDLAVSALALQAVNDLPGALTQIRRAMRPDGLMLATLFGGETLTELRAVLTQAEVELTGGASPRVAPFADLRDMGALLQRAGFTLPVADCERVTVRYDHLFALAADLRAMGATNVLVERSRKPLRRAVAARAAQLYAERFSDRDGRIRATFELLHLSGWAPHPSQQKPLPPGSARRRIAENVPS